MKHLLFVSVIFLAMGAAAQKKGQALADSLLGELAKSREDTNKVLLLNSIGVAYMFFSPKQEFPYMEQGLKLAEKLNWKKGIAHLNNNLGLMVGDTGDNEGSRRRFLVAMAAYKELGSKINLVNCLNNIGRTYQRESKFREATEYFFKALPLAEEIKNNQKIAMVCTNIAVSFINQNNNAKAEEYALRAVESGKLAEAPYDYGKGQHLMGEVLLARKDTAGAKAYLRDAIKTYQEIENLPLEASVLSTLAEAESDYRKKMEILERGLTIYEKIGEMDINSVGNKGDLGYVYYQLGLQSQGAQREEYMKKGEAIIRKAVAESKQINSPQLLGRLYATLAELDEREGDYKAALEHFRESRNINDSLFSQEKKNMIAGMEGQHKLDIKDKELALNKLMISDARKTQIGLIAVLLLIIVIAGLLYRQSQNRKKTNTTLMVLNNQLDEANKLKAKFFGILSHDLRSPIANLIHFLHLQKEEPGMLSEEQQAHHQQRISESAEDLLTNMESMLVWSKGQMENFKPEIRMVRVSDVFGYIQRFFGPAEQARLRFHQDSPDMEVSADENYLQIIMQNLTSNAIKALRGQPDGVIKWEARKEGDKTILSITDNGPGIQPDQVKALYEDQADVNARTGFGLHLIRDLARAIQYKISVQSQPGVGTTFVLSM